MEIENGQLMTPLIYFRKVRKPDSFIHRYSTGL